MDKNRIKRYWDSTAGKRIQEPDDFRNDFLSPLRVYNKIKILDAGCGSGAIEVMLSDIYIKNYCVGVDFSNSVKQAQPSFQGKPSPEFVIADLANLPFKEREFDVIVFSEVIEHIQHEERRTVLMSLLSLVSPNGFLFMTTPNASYVTIFARRISSFILHRKLNSSITTHIFDCPLFPWSLKKILSETGWQLLSTGWAQKRVPIIGYYGPFASGLPNIFFSIYQTVVATPKRPEKQS